MDLPIKNGWIFHSYVSLPEGIKRNIKWAIESLLNLLEIVDTAIEITLSLFPLRQSNIYIPYHVSRLSLHPVSEVDILSSSMLSTAKQHPMQKPKDRFSQQLPKKHVSSKGFHMF